MNGRAGFDVALVSVTVLSSTFATVTPSSRNDGLPAMPCTRWSEKTMSSAVTGEPSEKVWVPVIVRVSTVLSAFSSNEAMPGTTLVTSLPWKSRTVS
jgi:hypothetical protein